jgi:hypothetical protein
MIEPPIGPPYGAAQTVFLLAIVHWGAKREDPSSRKILRILTHGLPWPLF